MKIETKFDLGQEVFFLHMEGLYCSKIEKISVEVSPNIVGEAAPSICYSFSPKKVGSCIYKYESEVAASKDALIQRLEVHT